MTILRLEEIAHEYKSGNGFLNLRPSQALYPLSFELPEGQITGLLGPNSSGKSTLMQIMAGFIIPTVGKVTVGNDPILCSTGATQLVHLAREGGDFGGLQVEELLEIHTKLRSSFDLHFAHHLIERLEVDTKKKSNKLSRGKKSALAATIALASRAPITILDEVQLGMDVPSRRIFLEELLADQAETPRTYLISSHQVNELEHLLEHVVILRQGRLLRSCAATELVKEVVSSNSDISSEKTLPTIEEAFLHVLEEENSTFTHSTRNPGERVYATSQSGTTAENKATTTTERQN